MFIAEIYAEYKLGLKNYFENRYDEKQKPYFLGRNYIKRIFLDHDMDKVNSILAGDYPDMDTIEKMGSTNPDDE